MEISKREREEGGRVKQREKRLKKKKNDLKVEQGREGAPDRLD